MHRLTPLSLGKEPTLKQETMTMWEIVIYKLLFSRQTSENIPVYNLRAFWRVNKHGDPNFLIFFIFFNVHIMNVDYAKFQKKFDSRTIERRGVTSRHHGSTISGWQQKQLRRRRQGERQKIICLYQQTTTLHLHQAFLYISMPSLHHYDMKLPNFTSPLCIASRR